jgi:enoyl-CoA hydratase/carnithine racemase
VDTDQGPVTYSADGAVATITMRTPALGLAAKQMLLAAAIEAGRDTGIRAVVLTGTGRVFTAGQDLGEHADALREARADAGAGAWPEVLAAEERDQAALGATPDHRGAVDAFLAKRRPEFTGHE